MTIVRPITYTGVVAILESETISPSTVWWANTRLYEIFEAFNLRSISQGQWLEVPVRNNLLFQIGVNRHPDHIIDRRRSSAEIFASSPATTQATAP